MVEIESIFVSQALGSVYLFHKRVEAVYMWNFRSKKQLKMSDRVERKGG